MPSTLGGVAEEFLFEEAVVTTGAEDGLGLKTDSDFPGVNFIADKSSHKLTPWLPYVTPPGSVLQRFNAVVRNFMRTVGIILQMQRW
jgi:hypothetical protein